MTENVEKMTIKKLTSVGSVLKNPFRNLEEVLTQLGNLDDELFIEKEEEHNNPNLKSEDTGMEIFDKENNSKGSFESSNESLKKVLSEIGEIFTVCSMCGKQSLRDEMISGVCFDCNLEREKLFAENEEFISMVKEGDLIPLVGRIGDLEAQIRNMKLESIERKTPKKISREYLNEIIEEIIETVRKDIQIEIKTIKKDLSAIKFTSNPVEITITPPPPPPSSLLALDKNKPSFSTINFSVMSLETLKSYKPEFLASLPLAIRNQYNTRLRELQQLERMTPEQKKVYFEKKAREKEQVTNYKALKTSLKNLSKSDNPLFLKMRKQADKAILAGTGTLGNLGPKRVYIICHVCDKTNEIIEGEEISCKFCKSSLNVR